MEQSLFEKIATGQIPSYKVWEDDNYMAFLDIFPKCQGHTLVIPKKNIGDYIFDLSADQKNGLMQASSEVAKILETAFDVPRIFMLVAGVDVPHVHVHLIPHLTGIKALGTPNVKADDAELKATLDMISASQNS